MKIKLPIFYWIKILIVSIIIVLLTYFIKGIININPFIETGLIILIIGVVYIVTLYLIGILDIAEIKQILIRYYIKYLNSIFIPIIQFFML